MNKAELSGCGRNYHGFIAVIDIIITYMPNEILTTNTKPFRLNDYSHRVIYVEALSYIYGLQLQIIWHVSHDQCNILVFVSVGSET